MFRRFIDSPPLELSVQKSRGSLPGGEIVSERPMGELDRTKIEYAPAGGFDGFVARALWPGPAKSAFVDGKWRHHDRFRTADRRTDPAHTSNARRCQFRRSDANKSEIQSLMRLSNSVFGLQK